MRKILFICLLSLSIMNVHAQSESLRIADTLTPAEKNSRRPVILRTELDSLINVYRPQTVVTNPVITQPVESKFPLYVSVAGIAALLIIGGLLYLIFLAQRSSKRTIYILHKQVKHLEGLIVTVDPGGNQVAGLIAKKGAVNGSQDKKIQYLNQQLDAARKEAHELEGLKQQMMHTYKIRNYPGFVKGKSDTIILESLLETERSVAQYSYEHFLKPLLAIADANKNKPARISEAEREKMLELLISLSLLYSEYLYLRVNDLAIGGKMAERIGHLKNGTPIDLTLLKELNTDHGSRALALRLVLDKLGIGELSYPVFDETNLNLHN